MLEARDAHKLQLSPTSAASDGCAASLFRADFKPRGQRQPEPRFKQLFSIKPRVSIHLAKPCDHAIAPRNNNKGGHSAASHCYPFGCFMLNMSCQIRTR